MLKYSSSVTSQRKREKKASPGEGQQVSHLVWFTKAVWSMGIMLSGQGAVWLGGACCWVKWWLTILMSISGWAE